MKPTRDIESTAGVFRDEFFTLGQQPEATAYVLRGKLRCGACGEPWEAGPRGPRQAPCYGCSNAACPLRPMLCVTMDRLVGEALRRRFADRAALAALEPALRLRLATLATKCPSDDAPAPGDASWMLGVAQDFAGLWRHVLPGSQRKLLEAFLDHVVVESDAVQLGWAPELAADEHVPASLELAGGLARG